MAAGAPVYKLCTHIGLDSGSGAGSFELCKVVQNGGGNLDSDYMVVLVGNFV